MLAAAYLLCELLSQALFAADAARAAALGWLSGLMVAAVSVAAMPLGQVGALAGISYSLALGALAACAAQIGLYLALRRVLRR